VRARERDAALVLVLVGGVALFVAMWLLERHGEPSLDRDAFDVLASTPHGFLVRAANSTARPVGFYAVFGGALVTIGVLARRGRRVAAATVLAGAALVFIANAIAKSVFSRPRPSHELMFPVGGPAFPSSHAAYSTVLLALALVLADRLRRRRQRAALIGIALLAIALIGVWLIAVRVHYLTDVLAGWGLGAALFAAPALVASAIERRRSSA